MCSPIPLLRVGQLYIHSVVNTHGFIFISISAAHKQGSWLVTITHPFQHNPPQPIISSLSKSTPSHPHPPPTPRFTCAPSQYTQTHARTHRCMHPFGECLRWGAPAPAHVCRDKQAERTRCVLGGGHTRNFRPSNLPIVHTRTHPESRTPARTCVRTHVRAHINIVHAGQFCASSKHDAWRSDVAVSVTSASIKTEKNAHTTRHGTALREPGGGL